MCRSRVKTKYGDPLLKFNIAIIISDDNSDNDSDEGVVDSLNMFTNNGNFKIVTYECVFHKCRWPSVS